jgi:hypothetical protein
LAATRIASRSCETKVREAKVLCLEVEEQVARLHVQVDVPECVHALEGHEEAEHVASNYEAISRTKNVLRTWDRARSDMSQRKGGMSRGVCCAPSA